MSGRKALITGATGFVGSRLVRHLLAHDWTVEVIVRPRSRLDQLATVRNRIRTYVCGDGAGDLADILANSQPTVVFHLASLFLSEHAPADVPRLVDCNLLFGAQLLEAMNGAGIRRLVNTGTAWQHFRGEPYCPVNLYAATKQAFEDLVAYYVDARDFSALTLKLYDTYGNDDPRPKLMALLGHALRQGEPLALSPGEQLIDLVHVDDVTEAFRLAGERVAESTVNVGEAYGVASGAPLSLRDLVALIEEVSGRRLAVDWGARPYRAREVMSPPRLAPLPGWQARISLREGLVRQFQIQARQTFGGGAA